MMSAARLSEEVQHGIRPNAVSSQISNQELNEHHCTFGAYQKTKKQSISSM